MAGLSCWHRIQRNWPITKICHAINHDPRGYRTVAIAPSLACFRDGIKVDLDTLKQGSYMGYPASLLVFYVTLDTIKSAMETCFEVRMTARSNGETSKGQSRPYVAAYGPAQTQGSFTSPESTNPARLASVTMRQTDRGVLVIVRDSKARLKDMPHFFHFAVIVVHLDTVILTVIPSTNDKIRAVVPWRTRLYPVILDLAYETSDEVDTCDSEGEQACHSTCRNLSPDHMTAARWTSLTLSQDLYTFSRDSHGNVRVRHEDAP